MAAQTLFGSHDIWCWVPWILFVSFCFSFRWLLQSTQQKVFERMEMDLRVYLKRHGKMEGSTLRTDCGIHLVWSVYSSHVTFKFATRKRTFPAVAEWLCSPTPLPGVPCGNVSLGSSSATHAGWSTVISSPRMWWAQILFEINAAALQPWPLGKAVPNKPLLVLGYNHMTCYDHHFKKGTPAFITSTMRERER